MSFLIDIKRKNARDEAIKKLEIWAYMMKNGVPPATDFIPSCSTSLLVVSNDQPNPKAKERQIINAIIKEDEYREFVNRYTAIVYSLDDLEKEAIINKYLNEYTNSEIRYGNNKILGNDKFYVYLERAYTNIIFMDETIDYDLNDYFAWKNSYYGKRSKQTEMRESALIYLSKLNTEINSKRIDDKEIECVNLIPELQREALINYINKKKKLTSYEWRKIKQAICSFMYIHKDFDYDIEEYKQDMQDTNKAWKKCFNFKGKIIGQENGKNIFDKPERATLTGAELTDLFKEARQISKEKKAKAKEKETGEKDKGEKAKSKTEKGKAKTSKKTKKVKTEPIR